MYCLTITALILTGTISHGNCVPEKTFGGTDPLEMLLDDLNSPPKATPTNAKRAYWPMEDNLAKQHEKAVLDIMNPLPATAEPPPKKYHFYHTHRIFFVNAPFQHKTKPKKSPSTNLKHIKKETEKSFKVKPEISAPEPEDKSKVIRFVKKVTAKRSEDDMYLPTVQKRRLPSSKGFRM